MKVKFRVVTSMPAGRERRPDTVYLWSSAWDDWFKFSTLYNVSYVDSDSETHHIGETKIGEFGLKPRRSGDGKEPGFRSPTLPARFSTLDERFFSLGQDTSFYEELSKIGSTFRMSFLAAINDIAFDAELRVRAESEQVTGVSLLRNVPLQTVREQYARLARGGARLTSYKFVYRKKQLDADALALSFAVDPSVNPPTNIHVLIGRNGVGKSTVLNGIAKTIIANSDKRAATNDKTAEKAPWDQFSNVVSVSFSAFDSFAPLSLPQDRRGLPYHYVGLKKVNSGGDAQAPEIKDPAALAREMSQAVKTCLVGARHARLTRALRLLEGDPIFASIGIGDLIGEASREEVVETLPKLFRRLSSGHKIVLLTVTKLVETVEEKSLVLFDEPEAHLHPPLLSAFIRALSDLLTNRNGMAIIATHSPVVLQEVPKSCVWKLQRAGDLVTRERPSIETFGENVGILTDEIFGLEVTATGFHKFLADLAGDSDSYEEALEQLGSRLGTEGRAILRAMLNARSGRPNVAR